MSPEEQQEILKLRALNVTPKQIARKLGLKVSEVTAFIKEQAEQTARAKAQTGELPPIDKCLADTRCAKRLLFEDSDSLQNEIGGLGLVLVARTTGYNRYSVCTYLLDYWCLGLKDTIGPKDFNSSKYLEFVQNSYMNFPQGYQEITLEQAQAIVFGAIDYAKSLGFSPHRDFEQSRTHLGEWNGESKLKFGRAGRPFYISGPYDNFQRVISTLEKSAGVGNFDYFGGFEV
ncbi:DNA-binding response regulator [Phormidium sp. LEGE 05292]|uniref:DNA-binding response regulator n=1 Tax=[Phormidium] sp. LEGE 05292 TaxID=767427 RepID=UPI0018803DF6|nr:DNA-binding response regulator [Phormidium sp. LEGE 05292]MBE9227833.1 DNA-binding response regulator [Phormidium sp. LEGE 05292]